MQVARALEFQAQPHGVVPRIEFEHAAEGRDLEKRHRGVVGVGLEGGFEGSSFVFREEMRVSGGGNENDKEGYLHGNARKTRQTHPRRSDEGAVVPRPSVPQRVLPRHGLHQDLNQLEGRVLLVPDDERSPRSRAVDVERLPSRGGGRTVGGRDGEARIRGIGFRPDKSDERVEGGRRPRLLLLRRRGGSRSRSRSRCVGRLRISRLRIIRPAVLLDPPPPRVFFFVPPPQHDQRLVAPAHVHVVDEDLRHARPVRQCDHVRAPIRMRPDVDVRVRYAPTGQCRLGAAAVRTSVGGEYSYPTHIIYLIVRSIWCFVDIIMSGGI
jgi:hypothetical protein